MYQSVCECRHTKCTKDPKENVQVISVHYRSRRREGRTERDIQLVNSFPLSVRCQHPFASTQSSRASPMNEFVREFQMILYLERDLLSDPQCRQVYVSDRDLTHGHCLVSSTRQCSDKESSGILCKLDHNICKERCTAEGHVFLQQKFQSNIILVDHSPVNLVLFDQEQLKSNAEIVHICHGNNIPKPLMDYAKQRLHHSSTSSVDRVRVLPCASVRSSKTPSSLRIDIHGRFSAQVQCVRSNAA